MPMSRSSRTMRALPHASRPPLHPPRIDRIVGDYVAVQHAAGNAASEMCMYGPWFNLMMLGVESQQVIWLRLMKLAGGGAVADREARLMLTEKVIAASTATGRLMTGASP